MEKQQKPLETEKIVEALNRITEELGDTVCNFEDAMGRLMELLDDEITREDLAAYILNRIIPSVLAAKRIQPRICRKLTPIGMLRFFDNNPEIRESSVLYEMAIRHSEPRIERSSLHEMFDLSSE